MTETKSEEGPVEVTGEDLDQAIGGSGRRGELDHMGAYNFTVEIEGVCAGYFNGADGLQAEIEVIEAQETSRKTAG